MDFSAQIVGEKAAKTSDHFRRDGARIECGGLWSGAKAWAAPTAVLERAVQNDGVEVHVEA